MVVERTRGEGPRLKNINDLPEEVTDTEVSRHDAVVLCDPRRRGNRLLRKKEEKQKRNTENQGLWRKGTAWKAFNTSMAS